MLLTDATLDAFGFVYGEGRIEFPPGHDERFVASNTGTLRLEVGDDGHFTFDAAVVHRDTRTGYLVGEVRGPRVSLPIEIATLIARTFQFEAHVPRTIALDGGGTLSIGDDTKRWYQGLSDWRGTLNTLADGAVVVELSAALRPVAWALAQPFPVLDAWPRSLRRPRMRMTFRLNAATRAVKFEALVRQLMSDVAQRVATRPTSVNDMRLGQALIGTQGSYFARSARSGLVSVYGSHHLGLMVSRAEEFRHRSGLIQGGQHPFPRIILRGINLDVVEGALLWKRELHLALSGPDVGRLQTRGGSADEPGRFDEVTSAALDFELRTEGLVLHYVAELSRSSVRPSDTITIPWEVLILRSRTFGKVRERMLNEI